MAKVYDCIIIGGGPSGLAAGNILQKFGINFLIIEKGNYLYKRNKKEPYDIVSGIGGGGLYSDGKVSFFPSGSKLYDLEPTLLKKSYHQLIELFQNISINIPLFDEGWLNLSKNSEQTNVLHNKIYDSILLSQENLYNLGFYLYDQIGKEKVLINHLVTNINPEIGYYQLEITCLENQSKKKIKTRNIIFCAGKFGSLKLPTYYNSLDLFFKKFEFGIRVETDHKNFDFNELEQTDLKLLMKFAEDPGIEFRTFCFCRNGHIVQGKFEEISTFNGISNDPKYSKTNFGLNLRIQDEIVFNDYKDDLNTLIKSEIIVKQKVKEFLSKKNKNWNQKIFELFRKCLITNFPHVCDSDAEISGPSFEYFGYYPRLNNELRVNNINFWVCGDATGDFRGLLPSLTSGYLAAISYIEKDFREKTNLYDLIRLKVSPTSKTKTVFTAQSKKFFYTKDLICEFVFKKNAIPINPFQVFGYFLNDRVARSLVRNGNNELISRCDELWVFGPIADGVLFEISRAYQLKLPIRFFTIGTHLNDINEITDLSKLVFEPEVYSRIGKENLICFISQSFVGVESQMIQLKLGFDDIIKK